MNIGVLALQGAVTEHVRAIQSCGANAILVKSGNDLAQLDGLLLPGGESTAMRRLIDYAQLLPALKEFAMKKPVFGTCAGLILLASEVEDETPHIGQMRIKARRNAFGRQVESFEVPLSIQGVKEDFPAVFIRAPKIISVHEEVEVLATFKGDIVCARDRHFIACSFHPELTNNLSLMQYFLTICQEKAKA